MPQFVLRCTRVPVRAGKIIRHAMRHHWGLSHRAARHVWHGTIAGTVVTCVAVPVWLALPAPPSTVAPPVETGLVVDVPEPSSILPFVVGLVAILLIRKITRRRGHSAESPAAVRPSGSATA